MRVSSNLEMMLQLLLFLLPLAAGYGIQRSIVIGLPPSNSTHLLFPPSRLARNLLERQNEVPKGAVCVPPCSSGSCNSASFCSAGHNVESRSMRLPGLDGLDQDSDWAHSFHSFQNTSTLNAGLDKRLFTYNAGSRNQNDYKGSTAPTGDEAKNYLLAVMAGSDSANFGARLRTVYNTGDERAVSKQKEFKDSAFQIVTDGVYGCTVVVLVSNRGVWAAHLWEIYSSGAAANGLGADVANDPAFDDRVLKFMRGESVGTPRAGLAPSQPGPYIPPSGPGMKADLFNNVDSDETRLYIFTSLKWPTVEMPVVENRVENINQPTHYGPEGDVVRTVRGIIGHTPRVYIVPYTRLNRNDPADEALFDTSTRGHVIFQYDPKSDGNNKKAWRLFIEDRFDYKEI